MSKIDNRLEIDNSRLEVLFDALDSKNQTRVFRKALRKSANVLAKATKKSLRQKIGKVASHRNWWYTKTLQSGVKVSVDKNKSLFGAEHWFAKVHIMGDFRLKFFEKGTNLRKTEKEYNRGRMKATNFFAIAKESEGIKAQESLRDNVAESIVVTLRKIRNKIR